MKTFYYIPSSAPIVDQYSNYSNNHVKTVLNHSNLIQFKDSVETSFRNVGYSLDSVIEEVQKLKAHAAEVQKQNIQLLESMNWVGANFPEAIEALVKTARVAQKFDEADDQITWGESVSVQAGP